MSYPTITHGKGWQDDCNSLTPKYTWVEKGTGDGDLGSMMVENNDYFRIYVTAILGDKIYWWEYPDSAGGDNIGIDSQTYTKAMFRYKCNNANIKAKIEVLMSAGPPETILPETNTETLTVGTATITGGEGVDIDHVRLYANQAKGVVFYDWIMFYTDTYTFPNANLEFFEPDPVVPVLGIPFRGGGIIQNLGNEWAQVHITADMNKAKAGTSWGSPAGQYIDKICHEQPKDLWQWFTMPELGRAFRVYVSQKAKISLVKRKKELDLWLTEYKLGGTPPDPSFSITESYAERFGH